MAGLRVTGSAAPESGGDWLPAGDFILSPDNTIDVFAETAKRVVPSCRFRPARRPRERGWARSGAAEPVPIPFVVGFYMVVW